MYRLIPLLYSGWGIHPQERGNPGNRHIPYHTPAVYLLQKKGLHALKASLVYKPTGDYKKILEQLANRCGVPLDKVTFVYAYTQEMVGMTALDVVVVDPIVCTIIDQDSEALKVKDIFTQYIEPSLAEKVKKRLTLFKEIASPFFDIL